jgi:ring-1,2-phenylacetyl-CoA epoxidase subunit PaaA
MEVPIRNYIEFVVMQSMLDRAGLHWTKDLELHCSYAPYRRTLRKVNFEEGFHMRHGNFWTEFYWNQSEETRAMVQRSIDWIFPFGVMWFGKPDNLKTRPEQLKYKVRGWGNDFMRDKWLQSSCAFLNKLGADFPAEFDEETKKWRITMPYPMKYDAENYTWSQEQCTHDEYWQHSRKGGPMRPGAYERLRREEWGDKLW